MSLTLFEESKTQSNALHLVPRTEPRLRGQLGVAGEESPRTLDSLIEFAPAEAVTDGNAQQQRLKKGLVDTKKVQALREMLNAILPPRELVDASTNIAYRQCVSLTPSSREAVIELQRKLDARLQARQARESGICPIREELYSECFDELIRQVTISSPERGLLLLRVRDEMRLSLSSYQCLFNSSMSFGLRKCAGSEVGREELLAKQAELEIAKTEAHNSAAQAKALYESIERRITEQRQMEEKRMSEEKDFLKFLKESVESQLRSS